MWCSFIISIFIVTPPSILIYFLFTPFSILLLIYSTVNSTYLLLICLIFSSSHFSFFLIRTNFILIVLVISIIHTSINILLQLFSVFIAMLYGQRITAFINKLVISIKIDVLTKWKRQRLPFYILHCTLKTIIFHLSHRELWKDN